MSLYSPDLLLEISENIGHSYRSTIRIFIIKRLTNEPHLDKANNDAYFYFLFIHYLKRTAHLAAVASRPCDPLKHIYIYEAPRGSLLPSSLKKML